MPKYRQNFEDSFEPVELKVGPKEEETNRSNEILKCLDIKISEILNTLDNKKISNLNKIGVDEKTVNNLKIIKSNFEELIGIIKDSEIKIHKAGSFSDKIGQFPDAVTCLLKKRIDTIESGANKIENFKDYTNLCITDSEFLKAELGTVGGYEAEQKH